MTSQHVVFLFIATIIAALAVGNMLTVYAGWLALSGGISVIVILDIFIELLRKEK